jgi:hypothetical protein
VQWWLLKTTPVSLLQTVLSDYNIHLAVPYLIPMQKFEHEVVNIKAYG